MRRISPPALVRFTGEGWISELQLADGAPQPSGGAAVYEDVERPGRAALLQRTGTALQRWSVPVILDGYAENRDIGGAFNALARLWRSGDDDPPSFIVSGPLLFSGLRCVMEEPEIGPGLRNRAGALVRQELTLKLVEWSDPDTVSFSSTGQSTKPGKSKPGTYRTVAGDTLLVVSRKAFGKTKYAKQIGKLNGIRDTRKKLKAGRTLKLPSVGG